MKPIYFALIAIAILGVFLLMSLTTYGATSSTGMFTGDGTTNRSIQHGVEGIPAQCFVVPSTVAAKWVKLDQDKVNWISMSATTKVATTASDTEYFYVSGALNTTSVVFYWSCLDSVDLVVSDDFASVVSGLDNIVISLSVALFFLLFFAVIFYFKTWIKPL